MELIDVGFKYAEMIKTGAMNFDILAKLIVPKIILSYCYEYLLRRGIVAGIEKDGEEREEFISASVEFTGSRDMIYAKALYALNYMYNELNP